jgi:cytidylate kinase
MGDVESKGDINIAIDGPAGSGKSTVAQRLSEALSLTYIDSGAMYRGITLLALQKKVNLDSEEELAKIARRACFRFPYDRRYKQPFRVLLNGMDVTREIRSKRVTANVSQVAAYPAVRRELVLKQRELAQGGGVVMEGRDIGTVVLPHSPIKFYLTATIGERARRRSLELKEEGYNISEETIKRELAKRDRIDSTRPIAPLTIASDAIQVDTTGKSIEEVVDILLQHVKRLTNEARAGR